MKLNIPRTTEDDEAGQPLNLAQAIAEFYAEFPEHRQDVFILNHQAFETGKAAVESITPALESVQKKFPEARLTLAKSLALGTFEGKMPCSVSVSEKNMNGKNETRVFARIVIPAGDQFTARVLKSLFATSEGFIDNTQFPTMRPQHNDTQMWQRYVLDHELGHAITILKIDKQAAKSSDFANRAECEADAYAMIRHFQRYGEGSDFPAYIRDLRNMAAVHKGDVTHWTVRAIEEVIALNNDGFLRDLTPAQSRDLAVEIAARTHLSADAAHNMSEGLKEARSLAQKHRKSKAPDGHRIMDYIETVCKTGAVTKSPAVRQACFHYMQVIYAYAPEDLEQQKTVEEFNAILRNQTAMKKNKPVKEPPMTGLKRVFRDALIDVQSGVKRDGKNPPPKGPPSP